MSAPPPEEPAQPPSPAPDAPAVAARAYIVSALGLGPETAGEALVRRASIAHCARAGVRDHVRVQVMFGTDGEIVICQPDPNAPHGEESVARCVATALRAAGPLETSEAGGILIVEADL